MLELMTKFFIEREPTGRTEKGRSIDSFGSELSTGSRNAVKSDQPASNGDKYLTSLTRPATAALTSRRGDCVVHIVLPISFSITLIHPYWLTGRKALSYLLTYSLSLSASLCLAFSSCTHPHPHSLHFCVCLSLLQSFCFCVFGSLSLSPSFSVVSCLCLFLSLCPYFSVLWNCLLGALILIIPDTHLHCT